MASCPGFKHIVVVSIQVGGLSTGLGNAPRYLQWMRSDRTFRNVAMGLLEAIGSDASCPGFKEVMVVRI
jgi:hypothetical protein